MHPYARELFKFFGSIVLLIIMVISGCNNFSENPKKPFVEMLPPGQKLVTMTSGYGFIYVTRKMLPTETPQTYLVFKYDGTDTMRYLIQEQK